MRLLRLEYGKLSLVEFVGKSIPRYAVLSHTWGADHEEVTFKDIVKGIGKDKAGYGKIRFCRNQVGKDDLQYFWVDTCCIDKSSSAELSEAINSMFRWYHESAKCYVYLSDVSISGFGNDQSFQKSKWFTRGWTLQELIAPASVEFFSKEDQWLGDKQSLEQNLHEVTGIAIQALRGSSLSCFGVDERMSWAAKRQTKRGEDAAYSLLGIFDIHMPLIYGEGREKAMKRLRKEIKQSLKDDSADLSIAFSSREPNQNGEPFFTVPLNEEQKCMLIDSLRFNEIDSRQRTLKYAHVKTCKWLLKNSKYLNWLDPTKMDEHQGFFWIKGKAGTGKSTLMKYALSNTHKTMRNRIIASFFFNARGVDLEKSTTGTYRSLLLQLLEQNPQLQYAFESLRLPSSSIRKDYQWSNESLKALLEQVIRSLGESSAVFFIDALDECEEDQIRDMIAFFENVGEQAVSTGKQLQVCFSSRHYPHITIRNGLELILEGEEGHDQDITSYLNSELKIGNSQTTKQIRQDIQVKASGIFIWVVLVVRILNKEYDRGRIHALRQRLQEIPSDLYDLFVDSLTRDSHNRDELLLSIQWILYAKRPLSPEELYFAVLSETEPAEVSKWDPNEITTDTFQKLILSSSKGLAEITQSTTPTVQFIHESVKDFLLKENGLGKIWPGLGSNLQGQSHERLKECCLNVMNSYIAAHLKLSGSPQNALGPQITAYCLRDTFLFPFLEYAVSNVLYHADIAVGCGIAQEDLFRNFPLVQWIELIDLFEPHEGGRYAQDVSLLYVIADRGMSNLVRAHPSINPCLQWRKESYELPVFASFGQGGNEAFRAFLGADPVYILSKVCFL